MQAKSGQLSVSANKDLLKYSHARSFAFGPGLCSHHPSSAEEPPQRPCGPPSRKNSREALHKPVCSPLPYATVQSADQRLCSSSLEFAIAIPIQSLIYSFVSQVIFVKQLLWTQHTDKEKVRNSWRNRQHSTTQRCF